MDLRGDFLIIGSGIAALRAAIALAEAGDVLILTKADPSEGSTGYAQGGIAAAIGADDSPSLHGADTIRAGDGLCDEAAAEVLAAEGPRHVRALIDWGARFDQDARGAIALGREAAHSVRRILHAGDSTGREIGLTLWRRVGGRSTVRVLAHTFATELMVTSGVCTGARFLDRQGRSGTAGGRATLLATGGAGRIYRVTTNPVVATGDGIAMAYRAGARVADLEFVQFHPTVLHAPGAPTFLLSEALRGEGARLVNGAGERFMERYHALAELAPRDVVSRAIAREIEQAGGVYLTLAHLDPTYVRGRFPLITAECRAAGFDLASDRVPVAPAAHYVMGGVATDLSGRTSIAGLFAAGEVACTGVHGANRLASNSLLEGLVFGARAADAMREWARQEPSSRWGLDLLGPPPWRLTEAPDVAPASASRWPVDVEEARDLVWRKAGLFRDAAGLTDTLRWLEAGQAGLDAHVRDEGSLDAAAWRTANVLTTARLVVRAALRREESRGAHFRTDFPRRDDVHWKGHVSEARGDIHRT